MSRRKHDIPIILSHNTHTGIMVFPNRKMGGRDMCIVGLNREVASGAGFEMADIDWIKAVLHFSDVGSMRITAEALTKEVKKWKMEVEHD